MTIYMRFYHLQNLFISMKSCAVVMDAVMRLLVPAESVHQITVTSYDELVTYITNNMDQGQTVPFGAVCS